MNVLLNLTNIRTTDQQADQRDADIANWKAYFLCFCWTYGLVSISNLLFFAKWVRQCWGTFNNARTTQKASCSSVPSARNTLFFICMFRCISTPLQHLPVTYSWGGSPYSCEVLSRMLLSQLVILLVAYGSLMIPHMCAKPRGGWLTASLFWGRSRLALSRTDPNPLLLVGISARLNRVVKVRLA